VARVRLVHPNAAEAAERARLLRDAGHTVDRGPLTQDGLRALRRRPPAAVVIDLSRAPSQGRDMALWLRRQAPTRQVPLVTVGGGSDAVARLKHLLPDITHVATWRGVKRALARAMAHPPPQPAVPASVMAGYSGTPLPKKLGIRVGSRVCLVGAPNGFEGTLGALPDGAVIRHGNRGRRDVTLWFTRSRTDLERGIQKMAGAMGDGRLWIVWPKQASGVQTDVREGDVRRIGLRSRLVDYKICAVDQTWSGLCFARRNA